MSRELSSLEQLFAAQTRILRGIAARNGSRVLVGRCSVDLLCNGPNSFRIFIHAPHGLHPPLVRELQDRLRGCRGCELVFAQRRIAA